MNRRAYIDLAQESDFALADAVVRPAHRVFVTPAAQETLEPRVMQVLVALARQLDDVVSRDDLVASCWEGRAVGEDAIQRAVARVRRLGETSGAFTVDTIARVGYRLKMIGVATDEIAARRAGHGAAFFAGDDGDAAILATSAYFTHLAAAAPCTEDGLPDWTSLAALPGSSLYWTVPEALFAVLFAAAVCDGRLEPVEHDTVAVLVARSRALKTLAARDLAAVSASVVHRMRAHPGPALESACAALPADLRLAVFAHALDIVLCDGALKPEEARFLDALVAHFALPLSEVHRVADVILLKNRA